MTEVVSIVACLIVLMVLGYDVGGRLYDARHPRKTPPGRVDWDYINSLEEFNEMPRSKHE